MPRQCTAVTTAAALAAGGCGLLAFVPGITAPRAEGSVAVLRGATFAPQPAATAGSTAAAVALLAVAGAAAAARTSRTSRHAEASFNPAKQIGATAPLGFFDPAGFAKGDETDFRNLRAAEIKHGRVAMMAALGAVVQHFVKLPGFESVPSGLGAVTAEPGSYGMVALFVLSGALELGLWVESPDKEPGNFGDPLSLGQYNEDFRNKELNNGRMAMFAAMGIIAAELLTGKDAIQQFSG